MNCKVFTCFGSGGTPSDEDLSTKKGKASTPADKYKRKLHIIFGTLAALIICAIIVGWIELIRMPKVIDASAPQHIFSEERARAHLNQIAQRPHPFGSVDNERVANYIISYAHSLQDTYGSDVIEVQTQNVTLNLTEIIDNSPYEEAQIVNIAVLVKGINHDDLNDESNEASAVMVSCHYDGVPYGPAASDDGTSCATMLEMASALSSSPTKLNRDVLFVFTDAKEVGLLGSTTFFEGEDAHPWSTLPSIAINFDNVGLCGKEMFKQSNSRYGADAYFKYAPHPKAFSFSEWYDANIEEGWSDAVTYDFHGLHTLRLGCWSNSWAHHSIYDDIEHVSKGALQHMGENVLAIVEGITSETNFPGRMQQKEGTGAEQGDSGLFYFTLIGGYVFYLPSITAWLIFPSVAFALIMTMPFIRHFTKTGGTSRTIKATLKTGLMHSLLALLNFSIGIGACIAAFAAFCLWKQPTEYQLSSKANAGETANLAWNDLGFLPSTLSCFVILCTSMFVYMWPRKKALPNKSDNGGEEDTQPSSKDENEDAPVDNEEEEGDEEEGDDSACEVPYEINAIEMTKSQDVSMLGVFGAEGAPPSVAPSPAVAPHDDVAGVIKKSTKEDIRKERSEAPSLVQLGGDVYVGVFYFYSSLLFILSIAMKDALILVLGQSLFMWLGALSEMILSFCCVKNHWLIFTRALLSTVPALLFLSTSLYWMLSDFWYFPNETDLGKDFWFGAPAMDALCIGLVVPLFMPHLVMLPRKTYMIVGGICVVGFIVFASACITVSTE